MGIKHPTADDGDPPPITTVDHHPTDLNGQFPSSDTNLHHEKPLINGAKPPRKNNNKQKRGVDDPTTATSLSSSSSLSPNYNYSNSNSNSNSSQRGIRIPNKRRNPRFSFRRNFFDVDAIAFPLGMSIAAVFAQVLEKKDLTSDSTSIDYLSRICTSAVRESLTNVFGEKFDAFAVNFEKSFGSTLSTIRLIKNAETDNGRNQDGTSKVSNCQPDGIPVIPLIKGDCSSRSDDATEGCTELLDHTVETLQYLKANENIEDHVAAECRNEDLPQGLASWQLAHSNQRHLSNHLILSTIEKSVSEQTRANELKCLEIGLIMKKLQLKETQLALDTDSNFLERCKLSLGISRTSFKVEKFKTQLEEAKCGELFKTCADWLVADLIIMSCCLCYGVYAFSYDNLRQLTKSCYPPEGSKSWWRPMASFNIGRQTLSCLFQVYSRMIFGGLIIGAVAMALIQRSEISRQGMPITFIVLLLGCFCGFVGKVCVDTLGGNGFTWLMLWEVLCFVHFLAVILNPGLYFILYGAVQVCQGTKYRSIFPFWARRWMFFLFLLLLPVCCGLLPFASASTWWEDHISVVISNRWSATFSEPFEPFDAGNEE